MCGVTGGRGAGKRVLSRVITVRVEGGGEWIWGQHREVGVLWMGMDLVVVALWAPT